MWIPWEIETDDCSLVRHIFVVAHPLSRHLKRLDRHKIMNAYKNLYEFIIYEIYLKILVLSHIETFFLIPPKKYLWAIGDCQYFCIAKAPKKFGTIWNK